MSYRCRKTKGDSFEYQVYERLKANGFTVDFHGSALLRPEMLAELKCLQPVTPLRWLPDLWAIKGSRFYLIDVKSGEKWRETGNHDVEVKALETLDYLENMSSTHLCRFIFSDWTCATPQMVHKYGRAGTFLGRGSGTPFLIFPRKVCYPFEDEFGAKGSLPKSGTLFD